MKKFIGLFIIMIILGATVACGFRYEYEEVTATVINKEYTAGWVQIQRLGKTKVPINHLAKYEVTIQYRDYTHTFDNEAIYNSYEMGDQIKAYLSYGYSKDNELKTISLVLNR